MNTCNQCNKETDKMIYRVNVDLNDLREDSFIGGSKEKLCPDCRVKAEIELRDFIKQSKYFTELKPF